MATIDSSLRLVLPLRQDAAGNATSWAYHTPLSIEAFEASYRILAAAKGAMFAKGASYAYYAGVHVAALHLRDAGKQDAAESGDASSDAAGALLAELHRLTTVALRTPDGWDQVPLDVAKQRGSLDDADVRDLENALVFFSCAFWLTSRARRKTDVGIAASAMAGSITSLSLTEWIASLPKSIPDASSTVAE